MPIDYSIYPPYWKQFSLYIRKERAGDRCEKCSVRNGAVISRGRMDFEVGPIFWFDHSTGEIGDTESIDIWGVIDPEDFPMFDKMTKIVLTVAHLDNAGGVCDCKERTGRKCAIPSHVLALCQACHLRMDLPHHIEKRRQGLATAKDMNRGLFQGI